MRKPVRHLLALTDIYRPLNTCSFFQKEVHQRSIRSMTEEISTGALSPLTMVRLEKKTDLLRVNLLGLSLNTVVDIMYGGIQWVLCTIRAISMRTNTLQCFPKN